jgi:hypothetical protein
MTILGSSGRRFRSAISALFPVLVLILVFSAAARADTWNPGDVITYSQAAWGTGGLANSILLNNAGTVYAQGGFEIGIPDPGFSALWTDLSTFSAYIPAGAPPGALNADLLNPTTTSSGDFGGGVTALKLNIDFSDAGITLGNDGIPFGDLILVNVGLTDLDGLTVRQVLGVVNTALGGGTTTDSIANLDPFIVQLDVSFYAGTPSTFAQTNLVAPTSVTPTPEPSSLLLLTSGLLALGIFRYRQRRHGVTDPI